MEDTDATADLIECGYLDDADTVSDEGREWYLDVVHGLIKLGNAQVGMWLELQRRACQGTMYDSETQAYLYEAGRVHSRFAAMVEELGNS